VLGEDAFLTGTTRIWPGKKKLHQNFCANGGLELRKVHRGWWGTGRFFKRAVREDFFNFDLETVLRELLNISKGNQPNKKS
jgi:hypothetical protein